MPGNDSVYGELAAGDIFINLLDKEFNHPIMIVSHDLARNPGGFRVISIRLSGKERLVNGNSEGIYASRIGELLIIGNDPFSQITLDILQRP